MIMWWCDCCRNISTASVNVSITHRPSIPPPVSKFYSVSKLVEEGENMVLKRNKKSFQTKVYNFLERPSGKLCITYHISVLVLSLVHLPLIEDQIMTLISFWLTIQQSVSKIVTRRPATTCIFCTFPFLWRRLLKRWQRFFLEKTLLHHIF